MTRAASHRSLFDAMPGLALALDLDGCIVDANPGAERILGHAAETLHGRNVVSLVPQWEGEDADPRRRMERLLEFERHEVIARHAGGERRHLSATLVPSLVDGRRTGYFLIANDVTRVMRASRQLQVQADVIDRTHDAVVVLDDAGLVLSWNQGATRLYGEAAPAMLGRRFDSVFPPDDRARVLAAVADSELGAAEPAELELRAPRPGRDAPWMLLSLSRIPGPDAGRELVVAYGLDISARRLAEERSTHDSLTGLPNRSLLIDRMRQALAVAPRGHRVPALLLIDLDYFREVNESLGHDAGDEVLLQVVARLKRCVRPGDSLSRLGADEFIVLLPDLARAEDASIVADKILQALAQPYTLAAGRTVHCTCSIGVAVADRPDTDATQLIQQAGLAVHAAKRAGRRGIRFYSGDLAQRVSDRLEMRTSLQSALRAREFELHYQPQLDLLRQRICGVEALVRWHHPVMGLLIPRRFVPVAEETGQIVAIGEWVLEQACLQHRRWLDSGLLDCAVAVNVSGVQLRHDGFVESVAAVLAHTGLPGHRLELELTESVLMDCGGKTLATLERLHALGVGLSIDDFGTGSSSLARLKRLPIDKIKIDGSFVADITRHSDDAAITLSVIAIAHHLRLRVIAEGVETAAQMAYLKRHLCDGVQGFAVSHPLPAPELALFLAGYRPAAAQAANDVGSPPTLLLVDDEPNVLRALTRILRRDGYRILTAQSAADAFEVLAQNEVHVILSDQRMAQMRGTDFLSEVKSLYPRTVRMVLSGYTDLQSVTDAINRGAIYRFLTKPWDDEPLRAHVKEAFLHQQRSSA
jgi:diguanylate cyclase (GGDEF)-like protein/PAS domain S-box-containing protein